MEQATAQAQQLSLLSNARAQEVEALKGMYTALQASLSWRLTYPLRLLVQVVHAVTVQGMAREQLLRGAARNLARYPRLSRAVRRLLRLVPPVYTRVIVALDGPLEKPAEISQAGLNDRAREIHRGLAGRLGVDLEDS